MDIPVVVTKPSKKTTTTRVQVEAAKFGQYSSFFFRWLKRSRFLRVSNLKVWLEGCKGTQHHSLCKSLSSPAKIGSRVIVCWLIYSRNSIKMTFRLVHTVLNVAPTLSGHSMCQFWSYLWVPADCFSHGVPWMIIPTPGKPESASSFSLAACCTL